MASRSAHRRSGLPRRELVRDSDGTLRDVAEKRRIGIDELRDDLRAGRHFRARTQSTDTDCTHEVLREILVAGAVPGASSGGGLAGLLSLLGAFGNIANNFVDLEDERHSGRNSRIPAERRKPRSPEFFAEQE